MHTRERYLVEGPDLLGDSELLALVIGPGNARRGALEVASAALTRLGGMASLARSLPQELEEIDGLGIAAAVRLHAAMELGRRALREPPARGAFIGSPPAAWSLFGPRLAHLPHEELHAAFLDRRKRVIAVRCMTVGTDALTLVDPRQIFHHAVRVGAAAVILAHNHPSGDPEPSEQDRQVTRRVDQAGRTLGVRLVDHLVLAFDRYVSLAERGELAPWEHTPAAAATG
jgi:DNA repair protein RadC